MKKPRNEHTSVVNAHSMTRTPPTPPCPFCCRPRKAVERLVMTQLTGDYRNIQTKKDHRVLRRVLFALNSDETREAWKLTRVTFVGNSIVIGFRGTPGGAHEVAAWILLRKAQIAMGVAKAEPSDSRGLLGLWANDQHRDRQLKRAREAMGRVSA